MTKGRPQLLAALRLAISWATLFVIGTDLFVVSPILSLIADDLKVEPQSAGLTVMTFAFGYVAAAPIFGHLADRIGRRRVLTCCLTVFAAANFLTAAAHHLPSMMAARLLCGIAAAGVTPSIYVLTGISAPAGRRGTWIAIVLTGLLSSLPLGAPIGEMVSLMSGWPTVFVALAVCALVLVPMHHSLWPGVTQGAASPASPADGFTAVALITSLAPTVAWSTALYGMYTYLGVGLGGLGFSPHAIAGIVGVYGAAAFAGALLGGRIADRLGADIAIRTSLTGLCVCFILLLIAIQHDVLVAAAFGMTSLFAQIFFPAQQSLLLSTFPNRNSTALSWNNCALFLGIALGSVVGGQAVALGGFTAILPISALLTIAGWVGFSRNPIRTESPRPA
jgi:predicted MFS family arabinose efflux permease